MAAPVGTSGAGWRALLRRHDRAIAFAVGLAVAVLLLFARDLWRPAPAPFFKDGIGGAPLKALGAASAPSRASRAAETIRQAVVRVNSYMPDPPRGKRAKKRAPSKSPRGKSDRNPHAGKGEGAADEPDGTGSGVVIAENGTILTNLHVVYAAKRLTVTFHDGSTSEAELLAAHPEKDLAVIRAPRLPDDLKPATLGSAGRLRPGDEVVAVGFPFAIGPSVSAGVVSGLQREFRSTEGERLLTGLIQFDAAANPGSSGGPLVTMNGDVVGIVTAILNPTEARTFIGIGFATTMEVAGRLAGVPPF